MTETAEDLCSLILTHLNSQRVAEAGNEYSRLTSDQKGLLLRQLKDKGISQKTMAESFGVSESAISQRLKGGKSTQSILSSIKRLDDLKNAGFTPKSIAAMLNESGASISSSDLEAFFKVKDSLSKLTKE